ncbi:hypothetical protein [Yoonia sp. SDW83-1]
MLQAIEAGNRNGLWGFLPVMGQTNDALMFGEYGVSLPEVCDLR